MAKSSSSFESIVGLLILLLVAVLTYLSAQKKSATKGKGKGFATIQDKFETLEAVQEALRKAGLESCNLIIGLDFTMSNHTSGAKSFGGRSLHHLEEDAPHHTHNLNPYQHTIGILGRTLAAFDDDGLIPLFGFGDATTQGHSCFQIGPLEGCHGFEEVLAEYQRVVPRLQFSGPTNFAPVIRRAINIVKQTTKYHILILICDGLVINKADTEAAIVEASNYPLSIVIVGVGDGPFGEMHRYDDELPRRKFDNVQFVDFTKISSVVDPRYRDTAFAVAALQEIPEQYTAIQRLRLLK